MAALNASSSMEMSDEASPSGSAGLGTEPLLYMDDGRYKGLTQDIPSVLPIEITEKTLDVCSPSVKALPSTLRDDAPIRSGHPHLLLFPKRDCCPQILMGRTSLTRFKNHRLTLTPT